MALRRIFAVSDFQKSSFSALFRTCGKTIQSSVNLGKGSHSAIIVNPLTPNDPYRYRTAPLTSKRCILYIYSTNTCTEYFKHGIYSPFFSLQNAVCFIVLTYLVPVLFKFYIPLISVVPHR